MPHTSILIVNEYFKNLSQINVALVPVVLSVDVTTQMEPSPISKKYKFWTKNITMYF
jgi:hypothetical protein